MKKFNPKIFFLFLAFILAGSSCIRKPVVNFMDGSSLSLDSGVVVLVFLNSECPICLKYAGKWKQMLLDSIPVTFVFPGRQDMKRINRILEYDSIPFNRVCLDSSYVLSKQVNATTTPQAVILFNGQVRYSGKIDNRYEALGSYKPQATADYVRNALNSLKKNVPVEEPFNQPVGCLIEHD